MADWTAIILSVAVIIQALVGMYYANSHLRLMRHVARLTHRVWILEGSPPCPECDNDTHPHHHAADVTATRGEHGRD